MSKMPRRILLILAALCFVIPCAWASTDVVDINGTHFSVYLEPLSPGAPTGANALAYRITRTNGSVEEGRVDPSQDSQADRSPQLFLAPTVGGPVLIWSRQDGIYFHTAHARYDGNGWTEVTYLSSGPRDHLRPQAGIDAEGRGYVLWMESESSGRAMYALFDPLTGQLMTSPRNFLGALRRFSPLDWLGSGREISHIHRDDRWPLGFPEGGNDAPAIPPGSNKSDDKNDKEGYLSGSLILTPTCSKAVVAVSRNRNLAVGVLEGGGVVWGYRKKIPVDAAPNFVDLLMETILNTHCQ